MAILLLLSSAAVGGTGFALTAAAEDAGKAICLVTNGAAEYILGAQQSNIWFGSYKQSSDGADGFNVDPIHRTFLTVRRRPTAAKRPPERTKCMSTRSPAGRTARTATA